MFKDIEKQYQVYHTILSMVLAFALTFAVNEFYNLNINIFLCALFSSVITVGIYLFDCNRRNAISYFIVFSIVPIVLIVQWLKSISIIEEINNIIQWCKIYDGTKSLYESSYAHIVVFLIALVGGILFYILMKFRVLKTLVALMLIITLILLGVMEYPIHKVVIAIAVFYILTVLVELYGSIYNKRIGKVEKQTAILYLAPVCLLLALISVIMPSKPEPIKWKGVRRVYANVIDVIDGFLTDIEYNFGKAESDFAISFTGYSEDNGLLGRGSIQDSKRVLLKAYGYPSYSPTYLVGSVRDRYTGNSWEKSKSDFVPGVSDYYLDYAEFIFGLSRQEKEVLKESQFVERRILKLEYQNIKTKTIFYPLKLSWFQLRDYKDVAETQYSSLTFSKPKRSGTTYETVYYEMNLGGTAFQDMLRQEDNFTYRHYEDLNREAVNWVESNYFIHSQAEPVSKKDNIYELLKNRSEVIYEQYTDLPQSLPERVKVLAHQITKHSNNKFDQLKAIEEYLHTFPYTTTPGRAPEDRDFLDYFLFEQKEGYCTSFATALAILGRCIGIPTRYVEGVVIDYDEKENGHTFIVRNNQAHAWAEAYLEGIGWIPFEATPSYYGARYIPWKEKYKVNSSGTSAPVSMGEEIVELINQRTAEATQTQEQDTKQYIKVFYNSALVLLGVFLLLLLFSLYYSIMKYRYRKAFQKADNNRKMYLLFLRILMYLKWEGFALSEQETILMLSNRIDQLYHYDTITFPEVAAIYMKYRYADASISDIELNKVTVFHEGMQMKYREERKRFKVLLEEFFYLSRRENYR